MKLLICTQTIDVNDPILGFFHRWVEEFAKHFERIDVICLQEGEHDLPEHVHVHSLGKESGKSRLTYLFRFYRYFWKYYVRQDVNFVFYHMGAIYNILGKPFYLIRKLKKTKFIWWKTHGHINLMGRVALLFVDEVVTASEESFPVSSRKRRVVGHAIDTELFNYVDNYVDNYVVLFVGRISRVKRVEQVIAVLSKLKKKDERYRARIIGPIADSGYHAELVNAAKEQHLEKSIEFVPGVSQGELLRAYQEAVVLINPSDTDGLDKVVLEAMACGCIPVTANISFKEMLSPYGLYMEKGDIEGYAACIDTVTHKEEEALQKLRRDMRNVVVEDHALATLSKRIFNVG